MRKILCGAGLLCLAFYLVVARAQERLAFSTVTKSFVTTDSSVIALQHVRVIDGTGAAAREHLLGGRAAGTPGLRAGVHPPGAPSRGRGRGRPRDPRGEGRVPLRPCALASPRVALVGEPPRLTTPPAAAGPTIGSRPRAARRGR